MKGGNSLVTTNQINYIRAVEEARHNRSMEAINQIDVYEKERHNLVSEGLSEGQLQDAINKTSIQKFIADTDRAREDYLATSKVQVDKANYNVNRYKAITDRLNVERTSDIKERQLELDRDELLADIELEQSKVNTTRSGNILKAITDTLGNIAKTVTSPNFKLN